MKSQILSKLGALTAIALIILLGCQKTPNQIPEQPQDQLIVKTELNSINPNNPYDSAIYYYYIEALVYVNNTQESSESEDFDDYWSNFEYYISNDPLSLISYDTSDIDDIIMDSVSSFVDILKDTSINLAGFLNKAKAFENRIVNDTNLTSIQKNLILYTSAGLKQIRFIFETEVFYVTIDEVTYQLDVPGYSWEDYLNECINARLEQIFSNPMSFLWFFLPPGPSVNFLVIVAECSWEASVNYWSW